MKLPINAIAKFMLRRVVVPSLIRAQEKGKINGHNLKDAVGKAVQDEVQRQVIKRAVK